MSRGFRFSLFGWCLSVCCHPIFSGSVYLSAIIQTLFACHPSFFLRCVLGFPSLEFRMSALSISAAESFEELRAICIKTWNCRALKSIERWHACYQHQWGCFRVTLSFVDCFLMFIVLSVAVLVVDQRVDELRTRKNSQPFGACPASSLDPWAHRLVDAC